MQEQPMPTIIFNGKTYNDINEMPANERQAFQQMSQMFVDKNGNGIPDFLEGDMVKNVVTMHSQKIDVNGQSHNSLDELSPEMRQRVDEAFQMLSKNGILQNILDAQTPPVSREPRFESKPFEPQGSAVIEEEHGRNTFTLVLGVIVLCFAIVSVTIAVLYFTSR